MIKLAGVAITALSASGMLIEMLLLAAHAETTNMLLRINTPSSRGDAVSPDLSRLGESHNGSSSQGG